MKTFLLALAAASVLLTAPTLHAQQPAADTATAAAKPAPRQTAAQRRAAAARARTSQSLRNQQGTFTNRPTNTRPATPTTLAPRTDGSVVRAIRSGQPLQQINPLAPAEYGSGRDVTRIDPEDPFQRAQGLKLFTVEF